MEFSGQYLTHDEYIGLGGTLDPTPFNLEEFKARKKIDNYTMGRLINLETQKQEVKLCIYEIIKSIGTIENTRVKSSENIDGVRVSYKDIEQESVYKDIIINCLSDCTLEDGTPYLYTGI